MFRQSFRKRFAAFAAAALEIFSVGTAIADDWQAKFKIGHVEPAEQNTEKGLHGKIATSLLRLSANSGSPYEIQADQVYANPGLSSPTLYEALRNYKVLTVSMNMPASYNAAYSAFDVKFDLAQNTALIATAAGNNSDRCTVRLGMSAIPREPSVIWRDPQTIEGLTIEGNANRISPLDLSPFAIHVGRMDRDANDKLVLARYSHGNYPYIVHEGPEPSDLTAIRTIFSEALNYPDYAQGNIGGTSFSSPKLGGKIAKGARLNPLLSHMDYFVATLMAGDPKTAVDNPCSQDVYTKNARGIPVSERNLGFGPFSDARFQTNLQNLTASRIAGYETRSSRQTIEGVVNKSTDHVEINFTPSPQQPMTITGMRVIYQSTLEWGDTFTKQNLICRLISPGGDAATSYTGVQVERRKGVFGEVYLDNLWSSSTFLGTPMTTGTWTFSCNREPEDFYVPHDKKGNTVTNLKFPQPTGKAVLLIDSVAPNGPVDRLLNMRYPRQKAAAIPR